MQLAHIDVNCRQVNASRLYILILYIARALETATLSGEIYIIPNTAANAFDIAPQIIVV